MNVSCSKVERQDIEQLYCLSDEGVTSFPLCIGDGSMQADQKLRNAHGCCRQLLVQVVHQVPWRQASPFIADEDGRVD